MSSSKILIGKTIKFHRQKKGLTLQDLADMLNADRQYVWRIENGKINMSLDYLDNVIKQLGCDRADFFSLTLKEFSHK